MKRTVRAISLGVALFLASAPAAHADPLLVLGSPGSILALDFEGDFFRFAGSTFAINVNNLASSARRGTS